MWVSIPHRVPFSLAWSRVATAGRQLRVRKPQALFHHQLLPALSLWGMLGWRCPSQLYPDSPRPCLCSLHKVLFTEQPETYYKWDNWPPESDRK